MAEEFKLISTYPSLPKASRGNAVVLASNPSGDKILYCNGNSVFTVPTDTVQSKTGTDIYTEHPVATTVAKMSPTGFYCASGDQNGNVRIWDTTQSTHILKATYPVFSGPVKDIAWDGESKRIAAVGEGKERFAHVFLFDTGTSNGNLSGQARQMNSVDFKPSRPFRIISGSDDNTVAYFEGPPFKFKDAHHEHTKFVHVTRFNNDGSMFASAGGDGVICLFNGADGTKIGRLEDSSNGTAHAGSIFGLSWSPDGTKIATASADKTVKIWNVANKSVEKTIKIGETVEDQQVGIIWTKHVLVSVSSSGFINFLNAELGTVEEVRQGHNKAINSIFLTTDKKSLFSADSEGHITCWDLASGSSRRVSPDIHKAFVSGIYYTTNGQLITTSWDDHIKVTKVGYDQTDNVKPEADKLPSQPFGLAVSSDGSIAIAACYQHITIKSAGKLIPISIKYNATCIALSPDNSLVVVGGQDSRVHVYKLNGTELSEVHTINHTAQITAVQFSPNGQFFAVTDQGRKVVPYSVANYETVSKSLWTFHTAKVNCVAWSPDNVRLATGSLDNSIIVWNLNKSADHPIIIKGAHAMSSINSLVWLDETTLISGGHDSNIKQWSVPL